MITPEEFPYIKSLYVNDCYTYKDFNIELHDYKPFSHLILTGKNGSGKSTILQVINNHVINYRAGTDPINQGRSYREMAKARVDKYGLNDPAVNQYLSNAFNFDSLIPGYTVELYQIWSQNKSQLIYSYLKAKRNSQVNPVNTVTKEADFTNQLQGSDSTETFIPQFKQYLVNKKVYQAFDQINKDPTRFTEIDQFFTRLTNSFRKIFADDALILEFQQENFEFFLKLSDGRQLTFDVLSEGFSALLSILLVRELICKESNFLFTKDCRYPFGISM